MSAPATAGNANHAGLLRQAKSDIVVQQPMISMTALFMRHELHARGGPGQVACTNGVTVQLWPAFFGFQPGERLGVLLHEYMHAALAHPLRAMRLKRRHGSAFRMDVLNVAADAIINKGIENGAMRGGARGLTLPEDRVRLEQIVEEAKAIMALTGVDVDVGRMAKVGRLTLEWLYDAMLRLAEAARACTAPNDNEPTGADDGAEGGSDGDGADREGAAGDGRSGSADPADVEKARRYLERLRGERDISLDELEGLTPGQISDGINEAGERIRNAIAQEKSHGSTRGNVFEELAADIPRSNTPWESAFRSATQRHLARMPVRRPTMPGRRVMTQEAMGLERITWSPARVRPRVPTVVVVLDSSGSIMPEEYLRYLAEIQAMKRRTNARVFAIVADAEVHSVQEVKDVKSVADVRFQGRGGTDFRPALAEAARLGADLVVYLTDLMGTFPDETPPMPVVWTLTTDEIPANYHPPFGRVVHVAG